MKHPAENIPSKLRHMKYIIHSRNSLCYSAIISFFTIIICRIFHITKTYPVSLTGLDSREKQGST
jgi:hypothetical protein